MITDKEIKALRPKENKYLVCDSQRLFVLVYPSGKKSFVFDYKDPKTRKLKRLTLGQYPQMSLKEAREQRLKLAYSLLHNNSINEKESINEDFQTLCEKYFAQKNNIVARTLKNSKARIKNYCKRILDYKLDNIGKNDILGIFEKLKIAKKTSVAKKLFSDMNAIFIYGINKDLMEQNPMTNIIKKDIFYKAPLRHYPTIVEEDKMKSLINDILETQAHISTKIAALLSLFTAQRSFSIRSAEWSDMDLEQGIWTIPAEKMKMKKKHLIHLSVPCVKMLKWYRQISDDTKLFTSLHNRSEIISDNTIRMMFRRMGYSNEDFTPHGFRSMFSTLAHEHRSEHKMSSDIIELCLAHTDKNIVRASYNFASNLQDRKDLMQWWGEFLCKLEPRLRNLDIEII